VLLVTQLKLELLVTEPVRLLIIYVLVSVSVLLLLLIIHTIWK